MLPYNNEQSIYVQNSPGHEGESSGQAPQRILNNMSHIFLLTFESLYNMHTQRNKKIEML